MKRLEGKVALVTGASGSIGAATARKLAFEGATVALHFASNEERAESLRQELATLGAVAITERADLENLDEARGLIERVGTKLGRLDVLVNNAGYWAPRSLAETSVEELRKMLRVDLESPLVLSNAALRYFPEGGGRIVHLSSSLARSPIEGSALLSIAKAGIEALTRSQALEWGARGITVNAVAPGPTSNATLDRMPEAHRAAIARRTPLGRLGLPEDIASVIAFLASDESRWITGQIIDVNGGLR
ncbi:MAG: SDR family oxidoreductase [Polyangiaceae bacterium]